MNAELISLAEALEEQASLASLNMSGAKADELLEWHAAAMLRKMAEQKPVAWMFVTRDRKRGHRDEFAAIDWSPSTDDDRELVSKLPLVYAAPVAAITAEQKAEVLRLTMNWNAKTELWARDEIPTGQVDEAATSLSDYLDKIGGSGEYISLVDVAINKRSHG